MEKIKVLYGFNAPSFIRGVNNYLLSVGYEVECIIRMSKTSIRDFLSANKDYDAAVLLEVFSGEDEDSFTRYEADELAALTDYTDINVIPVLNNTFKGTYYMQVLYDAGITSAVYHKNKKQGLSPSDIGKLIVKKRTRKEAREYYGILKRISESRILESDIVNRYVEYLYETDGTERVERFVNVCRKMSMRQIADFIKRIPDELRTSLMHYDEFFIILDIIKKCGYDLKIKRPKHIQIGLVTPLSGLSLPCKESELSGKVLEPDMEYDDYLVDADENKDAWDYEEDTEESFVDEDFPDDESKPAEEPKLVSLARFFDDDFEEEDDFSDDSDFFNAPDNETAEPDADDTGYGMFTDEEEVIPKKKASSVKETPVRKPSDKKPAFERRKSKTNKEDIEGEYLSKLINMQEESEPALKEEKQEPHIVRNMVCLVLILCSIFFIIYYNGLYVKFFDFLYGLF